MFPIPPVQNKVEQARANEEARIIQRANATFDRVMQETGDRDQADAAYNAAMAEMDEI